MSRAVKALLVIALSLIGAVPVYSICAHHQGEDWVCGVQCGAIGNYGQYCFAPSNPDRACWDSGTGGACAEDSSYAGCSNCGGPGGF